MVMTNGSRVVRFLRALTAAPDSAECGDADLLGRFVRRKDETAFTALVQRHGPLVFGLCRSLLPCEQDAEDAFQATFLVLVRRARSISKRTSLRSWLYSVAWRVAVRLKQQERPGEPLDDSVVTNPAPDQAAIERERRWLLHAEIARLPEKYREPVLLCGLEGKPRDEAARLLRCSEGAVKGRLERGRSMLRARLARRGLDLTAVGVSMAALDNTIQAALPAALAHALSQAATAVLAGRDAAVSTVAASLAQGVTRAMAFSQLKIGAGITLLLAVLLGAATLFARPAPEANDTGHQQAAASSEAPTPRPQVKPSPVVSAKQAAKPSDPPRQKTADEKPAPKKKPASEEVAFKVTFPSQLYLVRLKTKDVKAADLDNQSATFVIEHVYAGPNALKGTSFQYTTRNAPLMGSDFGRAGNVRVHLSEGGEGLWWLSMQTVVPPSGKFIYTTTLAPIVAMNELDRFQIRQFPYQKHRSYRDLDGFLSMAQQANSYNVGLAWAEAVELVYRSTSESTRGALLRQLALPEDSPIARWAITMLSNAGGKEAIPALTEEADNPELTVSSLLVIDRVLCRLDKYGWRKSAGRERLLRRCLVEQSVADMTLACNRLRGALLEDEIDFPFYAKVLDPVLARAHELDAEKVWTLGPTLSELRISATDPQVAQRDPGAAWEKYIGGFDWLMKQVKECKSPLLRLHAAAGFHSYFPAHENQSKRVAELRDASKDPAVRKELDYLLGLESWHSDDQVARSAAYSFAKYVNTGKVDVGISDDSPFFTGGYLVPRDKGYALPYLDHAPSRETLQAWLPGGLPSNVGDCRPIMLRPALIREPLLKQVAEKAGTRGRFYVVSLGYDGDRRVPLLVKVNRGYGYVIGFMGFLEPAPAAAEDLVRRTAIKFIDANNTKSDKVKTLASPMWCYGADPKYLKADRKKSWPPDPAIGKFGPYKMVDNWGLGKGERGPLPTHIDRIVPFADQRRALWLRDSGQRALDKLFGPEAFVAFLGRPDGKSPFTTLVVKISRGRNPDDVQAHVVGTLDGLH
jgi:RNA polymerase sigma factor (sigma-70 family)